MAQMKILVCASEAAATAAAAQLKQPAGGGYAKVDGPFRTDSVIIEPIGISPKASIELGDINDGVTWVVIGRDEPPKAAA